LEPEVDMCFIKFWSEMYHATRENLVNDAIEQLVRENDSLRETVKMLEEAVNGTHSEKKSALDSKNDEPPPIQKSTSGLLGPL
jgi:cell division protein FtsB